MLRLRLVRISLGVLLLVLAAAGSLLPLLQGWFFFALALLVLSPDIPLFRKILLKIQKRFPKLRKPVYRWKKKLGLFPHSGAKKRHRHRR